MLNDSNIKNIKNEYVKSDSNKENLTTVLRRSLALSRSLLGQKFVNIFEVLFWVNRSRTPCCCGKNHFFLFPGFIRLTPQCHTRLGWRDHQCQRVIDRPDLGSQLLET